LLLGVIFDVKNLMEVGEAAPRGSPPNRLVASAADRPGNERAATRHLTTRDPDRLPSTSRSRESTSGGIRVIRRSSPRLRVCRPRVRPSRLRSVASVTGRGARRPRRPGTAGPYGTTVDLEGEQSPWKERTSVTGNGGFDDNELRRRSKASKPSCSRWFEGSTLALRFSRLVATVGLQGVRGGPTPADPSVTWGSASADRSFIESNRRPASAGR
jgi:hypothetical protein